MKFAFLFKALDYGGAQKMLSFVINSVSNLADDIIIILQDETDIAYAMPANSHVVIIGDKETKKRSIFEKGWYLISQAKKVKAILIDNEIDVVCAFGVYYSLMAVVAAKKTKTKTLVSERRSPENLSRIWRILSSYIYPRCDRVVFQLEGACSFYKKINHNKTAIIPNPYFNCTNEVLRQSDHKKKEIVMAAARLEPEKGFDVGIRAMAEVIKNHPDYKMVIYGDGNFEEMYGSLIDRCNIRSHVEYRGFSRQIDIDISNSEIFLLPSRFEGIPNILMEAMGVGMPCIASDCPPGGPKMLLKNDEYGILVPVDDYITTAQAICKLIEDDTLMELYSQKATKVKERFAVNKIADQWIRCFSELLNQK